MPTFCTRAQIEDLLYAAYLTRCEELNPGICGRTIEAVSGEVAGILAPRWPLPWPEVPEIVRYITAVISAYRIVEAITSLVDTEATSSNVWLPLQKQWKYCLDLLDRLAAGRLKLPLPESSDDREDATTVVVAPDPYFDLRGF